MSPTSIVAYVALFAGVAALVPLVSLLIGRLLRPHSPTPGKLSTYECGEPAAGTSYVQFDLRFYVVALVFIIFEVEVAFFFPWATVFGKATELRALAAADERAGGEAGISPATLRALRELAPRGAPPDSAGPVGTAGQTHQTGRVLALAAAADAAVFFFVLLMGFAYVWYRGDLDWVRAMPRPAPPRAANASPAQ